jgi:N utilization substance protein A
LLRLVHGVGLRTLQFLEEGGYRTLKDIVREDPDRLAIKTGLLNKKARQVQKAARQFMETELPMLERARQTLREQRAQEANKAVSDASGNENGEGAPSAEA